MVSQFLWRKLFQNTVIKMIAKNLILDEKRPLHVLFWFY